MEVRYGVPYVSGIQLTLNAFAESVQVQDANGNPGTRAVMNQPGLEIQVTPYFGANRAIQGAPETYLFKSGAELDLDAVYTQAGDIPAQWEASLREMADTFEILATPEGAATTLGPKYYLRLDAWRAQLPWSGNRGVTAIAGLYRDAQYTKPLTYVEMVFADGQTLRARTEQKNRLEAIIAQLDLLIDGDETQYPDWNNMQEEQRQQLRDRAPGGRQQAQRELDQLNKQLIAPLSDLLSKPEVQGSIVALLGACFTELKAKDEDWQDVDVAQIMGAFALPDIS